MYSEEAIPVLSSTHSKTGFDSSQPSTFQEGISGKSVAKPRQSGEDLFQPPTSREDPFQSALLSNGKPNQSIPPSIPSVTGFISSQQGAFQEGILGKSVAEPRKSGENQSQHTLSCPQPPVIHQSPLKFQSLNVTILDREQETRVKEELLIEDINDIFPLPSPPDMSEESNDDFISNSLDDFTPKVSDTKSGDSIPEKTAKSKGGNITHW